MEPEHGPMVSTIFRITRPRRGSGVPCGPLQGSIPNFTTCWMFICLWGCPQSLKKGLQVIHTSLGNSESTCCFGPVSHCRFWETTLTDRFSGSSRDPHVSLLDEMDQKPRRRVDEWYPLTHMEVDLSPCMFWKKRPMIPHTSCGFV